jgi:signal transduction histidine kinase
MRAELLSSTPLRIAVLLSGIFILALGVSTIAAVYVVQQELDRRLDATIADTYDIIGQSLGDSDIADLVSSVQSFSRATVAHDRVFLLTDASGRVLAGNLAKAPAGGGWRTVPAAELGLVDDDAYRLYSGSVGGYRLLVGSSFAASDAVKDIVLSSTGWATAIFLVLVAAAGTVVAVRAQRRLDTIAAIMRRVGAGELAVRVPVSGRNDDIDRLSGQVNVALERLAALVEGMRQVSADIAHDLKTPLNRLSITVESAIEAVDADQPVRELLTQAQTESAQINGTFEALLRIAQVEAGARRARFAPIDITSILETIVEVYGDAAAECGQRLALEPIGELPSVLGDKELLIQLFANLVENALRHGGPGVAVSVSGRLESGASVVTIADTGPGIPGAERDKVFRRLYRLDKSRTTPGSGLGLSLVKAIADLHGGIVELSDNGPGLCATVRLPPNVGRPLTKL